MGTWRPCTGPASTFLGPEPCLTVDIDERTYHPAIRDNSSKWESGGLAALLWHQSFALDCYAGNLASAPSLRRAGGINKIQRPPCFTLPCLALDHFWPACLCPLWLPWQLAGSRSPCKLGWHDRSCFCLPISSSDPTRPTAQQLSTDWVCLESSVDSSLFSSFRMEGLLLFVCLLSSGRCNGPLDPRSSSRSSANHSSGVSSLHGRF